MISIDRVYKTVLTLANSDIRGNVTPPQIRLLINQVVNEIQEEHLFELNRLLNRKNRGLASNGLADMVSKLEEKISYFLTTKEVTVNPENRIELPLDSKYIENISSKEVEFERTKNSSEFNLLKRNSSINYPIFQIVGEYIKIAPEGFEGETLEVNYIRKPKIANWLFVNIGGSEIANPTHPNYQDIDLHESEEANVILKTLNLCGVNLKETDIQNFTTRKEQQEFNEEITN